jgi:hypothetical protein
MVIKKTDLLSTPVSQIFIDQFFIYVYSRINKKILRFVNQNYPYMTSFQQINFKDEILFNDYDEDLNMLLLASSEKIFELSSFLVIMTKADELTSYF